MHCSSVQHLFFPFFSSLLFFPSLSSSLSLILYLSRSPSLPLILLSLSNFCTFLDFLSPLFVVRGGFEHKILDLLCTGFVLVHNLWHLPFDFCPFPNILHFGQFFTSLLSQMHFNLFCPFALHFKLLLFLNWVCGGIA